MKLPVASQSEIAIIGGGAAGLMAALSAARANHASIALFERNTRCGAKIIASGGGRCNLTNRLVSPKNYYGGSKAFIRNVLAAFDQEDTIHFFESLGVHLITEEDDRVFPKSGRSQEVLNALLSSAHALGVKIHERHYVENVRFHDNGFVIFTNHGKYTAKKLLLAAGGAACPQYGTDGSGLAIARALGHTVTDIGPALVPIAVEKPKFAALAGITIDAALTLKEKSGKALSFSTGSLLFTHEGISGPAALNISRELTFHPGSVLFLNLLPHKDCAAIEYWFKQQTEARPRVQISSIFKNLLPDRLCEMLISLAGIDPRIRLSALSRTQRKDLSVIVTQLPLRNAQPLEFEKAHCTAGGVLLSEVRYQTMESRIIKGLYLAGEILDVDGVTGGYNFQWAWSSGWIAGRSMTVDCREHL